MQPDTSDDEEYAPLTMTGWGQQAQAVVEEDNDPVDPDNIKGWSSLADPNKKLAPGQLGSGGLHRKGKNYIPVDESTILRQRLGQPPVAKKKKQGFDSSASKSARNHHPVHHSNHVHAQPPHHSHHHHAKDGFARSKYPASSIHPKKPSKTVTFAKQLQTSAPPPPAAHLPTPPASMRGRSAHTNANSSDTTSATPKTTPSSGWQSRKLVDTPFWESPTYTAPNASNPDNAHGQWATFADGMKNMRRPAPISDEKDEETKESDFDGYDSRRSGNRILKDSPAAAWGLEDDARESHKSATPTPTSVVAAAAVAGTSNKLRQPPPGLSMPPPGLVPASLGVNGKTQEKKYPPAPPASMHPPLPPSPSWNMQNQPHAPSSWGELPNTSDDAVPDASRARKNPPPGLHMPAASNSWGSPQKKSSSPPGLSSWGQQPQQQPSSPPGLSSWGQQPQQQPSSPPGLSSWGQTPPGLSSWGASAAPSWDQPGDGWGQAPVSPSTQSYDDARAAGGFADPSRSKYSENDRSKKPYPKNYYQKDGVTKPAFVNTPSRVAAPPSANNPVIVSINLELDKHQSIPIGIRKYDDPEVLAIKFTQSHGIRAPGVVQAIIKLFSEQKANAMMRYKTH
ncbi:hypothetical protein BC940DRAFT_301182 [Gongronella butleri]|nr:hypothetical protein BC940DRAFT_301182 [Gongronella butleri]